jgi:transposase
LSTKIHTVVDGQGLPVRFLLSPGQASDQAAVPALLEGLKPANDTVADRGYDAQAVVDWITDHGSRPHIPTLKTRKQQRSVDLALYRQRNLIERFFNKLKHFRRIATRYEKLARNYLAAIALASVRIRLRHNESTS